MFASNVSDRFIPVEWKRTKTKHTTSSQPSIHPSHTQKQKNNTIPQITVKPSSLNHIRGLDNLTSYSTNATIGTGNTMTSSFCKTCGTLMHRRSSGFPGLSFCRIGTIDDLALHEEKLKPMAEQFVEGRVGWLSPMQGVKQWEGMSTG
jgi:hypothetical protein